ncbi:unnamed protein product [Calicophoron daubneyi]|uniref:Uncharacterized protein n=1 Tax=Calicophoron daubneyi TaxID=300641 RepID=A0AAV2TLE7_CALDB
MLASVGSNQYDVLCGSGELRNLNSDRNAQSRAGDGTDLEIRIPHSAKPPSPRCSAMELKAFASLVIQTRDLLQQTKQKFDKRVWSEIAMKMYSDGWPERSWLSVKRRGERILRDSPATVSSRNKEKSPLPSVVNMDASSVPVSTSITHPCASRDSSSVVTVPSGSGGFTDQSRGVSEDWRMPPPLIPSSEAAADILVIRQKSRCPMNVTSSICSSRISCGPQILSVCSKAVPNTSNTSSQTTNGPPGMSNGTLNTVRSTLPMTISPPTPVLQTIDTGCKTLTEVSPHENHDSTHDKGKQTSTVSGPNTTALVVPSSLRSSSIPQSSVCDQEFTRRMEIYKLKQDVLQLKRAYWIAKLKELSTEIPSVLG